MDIIKHVWSKAEVRGEDECWPWLGNKDKDSYGQITIRFSNGRRRNFRAARLILENVLGRSLYPGLQACHTCDNAICCNPKHLLERTNHWNSADRDRKGRTSKGEKHSLATKERTPRGDVWYAAHESHIEGMQGEKHPMAKLTREDVDTIRDLSSQGVTGKRLAKMFGIGESQVGRIIRRLSWLE